MYRIALILRHVHAYVRHEFQDSEKPIIALNAKARYVFNRCFSLFTNCVSSSGANLIGSLARLFYCSAALTLWTHSSQNMQWLYKTKTNSKSHSVRSLIHLHCLRDYFCVILLSLNLLLEFDKIPTPKEFQDNIASLSPEQQRFAKAYRSMQLSRYSSHYSSCSSLCWILIFVALIPLAILIC
jgi:hypothetical protein